MKTFKPVIFVAVVITLCLHSSCSTTDAIEPDRPKVAPEVIASALSQSNELFGQREDIGKLREAVTLLSKARDPRNRSFEVEWKFAKFNYFLGTQTSDETQAETAFAAGRDAGRIAYGLEPQRPEGYFWFGANLGEIARDNPLTVGVKAIDEVKWAMERVIAIKPDYENTSAYDVLGQVELETRLLGGSAGKAVELLEKGLAAETNNMNLRLHLAEAYLATKKPGEARSQLEQLLRMKPNPEYMIECREALDKAKKLLATKF